MSKYVLIVIALMFSTLSFAQEIIEQDKITQVLDQYHQAAEHADFERYFATMDENAIILGTDGSERWTKESFKRYVNPYFKKGRGWKYTPVKRNLTIVKANEVVLFDELLSNEAYGNCRGSGVLINTADGWKILQYNLTLVVPNDIATEVVSSIKKYRQLRP
ncbi:nuclear transport factor 2 family protein [Thalassotalea piscium]